MKAEYNSVRGLIRSEWNKKEGKVTLNIEIPVGSTATIKNNNKIQTVQSGKHSFVFELD